MILRLLHSIASHSRIYDCIQTLVGSKKVYTRLANRLPAEPRQPYVLDLGGGTGTIHRFLPRKCRYLCLDLEEEKLAGFLRKTPSGMPVQANATQLPLGTGSIDAVLCTLVSHHLTRDLLTSAFAECSRVLTPHGVFLFADALRREDRWLSRFMWSLDRGAHPHDIHELKSLFSKEFHIDDMERFTVWHEYVIMVLRKLR